MGGLIKDELNNADAGAGIKRKELTRHEMFTISRKIARLALHKLSLNLYLKLHII